MKKLACIAALAFALLMSCEPPTESGKPPLTSSVISIPNLALQGLATQGDTTLAPETVGRLLEMDFTLRQDSTKMISNMNLLLAGERMDTTVSKAMCCPCSVHVPECCSCPQFAEMKFASPTAMGVEIGFAASSGEGFAPFTKVTQGSMDVFNPNEATGKDLMLVIRASDPQLEVRIRVDLVDGMLAPSRR